MAQPIWITHAGLLGVIPEQVFYQATLLADTAPLPLGIVCTATNAVTNTITCNSTEGLYADLNVMFEGAVFGGIDPFVRYFVLDVISSTEFRITTTEFSTVPLPLTTATGSMDPIFTQHVYFALIAGNLPPGIQCSDNGLIVGVPKAVASLQGVPFEVNRDVVSKFAVRAYTKLADGSTDRIKDRTFELIVTGNNEIGRAHV